MPLMAAISLALQPASARCVCRPLAQSVGRVPLQSGGITAEPKPLCERHRLERLSVFRDQEGQVPRRGGGERRIQGRRERDRKSFASLLLTDREHAIAKMLRSEPYHIGAPLRRMKQQLQCEARLTANRMMRLE